MIEDEKLEELVQMREMPSSVATPSPKRGKYVFCLLNEKRESVEEADLCGLKGNSVKVEPDPEHLIFPERDPEHLIFQERDPEHLIFRERDPEPLILVEETTRAMQMHIIKRVSAESVLGEL